MLQYCIRVLIYRNRVINIKEYSINKKMIICKCVGCFMLIQNIKMNYNLLYTKTDNSIICEWHGKAVY